MTDDEDKHAKAVQQFADGAAAAMGGAQALAELVERGIDQFTLAGPEPTDTDTAYVLLQHGAMALGRLAQPSTSKVWKDGVYARATQTPAHAGRIGSGIDPWAVVFHTTDMLPNTFAPLVKRWQNERGAGGGAHFLIGRTPAEGLLQMAPVNRNGNHAGGPGHGWFRTAAKNYHPNLVSVGIEVHNAGGLRLVNKEWRWGEKVNRVWTPMGPAFDPSDVEVDPVHPLRGWHRFTAWQLEQLDTLLTDLEKVLAPMPEGVRAISAPETAPAWADVKSARIVGHCDLDAANRSDPWPPGMRWLRERGT